MATRIIPYRDRYRPYWHADYIDTIQTAVRIPTYRTLQNAEVVGEMWRARRARPAVAVTPYYGLMKNAMFHFTP